MTDYTELIKALREHRGWALNETLDAAADAIEELQMHVRVYSGAVDEAIKMMRSKEETE